MCCRPPPLPSTANFIHFQQTAPVIHRGCYLTIVSQNKFCVVYLLRKSFGGPQALTVDICLVWMWNSIGNRQGVKSKARKNGPSTLHSHVQLSNPLGSRQMQWFLDTGRPLLCPRSVLQCEYLADWWLVVHNQVNWMHSSRITITLTRPASATVPIVHRDINEYFVPLLPNRFHSIILRSTFSMSCG